MAAVDVGTRDFALGQTEGIVDGLPNHDLDVTLFHDVDDDDTLGLREPILPRPKPISFDQKLGLDEAVKITKRRAPVAKLDDSKLLSDAGIPKLRRSVQKKLKFKGKGHEYTDIARMLNFYQLWLDDLYPRAKFADGLSIIEKLGHTKRMQVMRKTWIDEGKSRMNHKPDGDLPGTTNELHAQTASRPSRFPVASDEHSSGQPNNPGTFDEGVDHAPNTSLFVPAPSLNHEDPHLEDDFDALLAESEEQATIRPQADMLISTHAKRNQEIDADEEDAMAEMERSW